MENEFKTVANAKGLEIPKYPKDFKKLVEKDRQLAEYLCMNYENLDSEDLGALLKRWSKDSAGFWILLRVKTCFINQSQVVIMQKEIKKSLAQVLAKASKRHNSEYRNFSMI